MKHRLAALVALAFTAACGESPTEPMPLDLDLSPSFSVVSGTPVALTNGGFESGATGWTAYSVDVGPLWQAAEGVNSVDLNAFEPGLIYQDIATTPGVTYTVVFALAGNPGWPQNVKNMRVGAAGTFADYSFDTRGKSGTDMGWVEETFEFVATDATTTLAFASLHAGSPYIWQDRAQGATIDDVRVFAESNDPQTMADCKKGGWQAYGFRNQGQCVRFVQTGKDSR